MRCCGHGAEHIDLPRTLMARLVGPAERTAHRWNHLETGPAGSTGEEGILSPGSRTWKIPKAAAVRGAARATPRGPAMTASRSYAARVRAGARRDTPELFLVSLAGDVGGSFIRLEYTSAGYSFAFRSQCAVVGVTPSEESRLHLQYSVRDRESLWGQKRLAMRSSQPECR